MKKTIDPHDLLIGVLFVKNAVERCSEVFLKRDRLTTAQFNILNLLGAGEMKQSELLQQLLVGKSSVSVVLNRMVRDDLVERDEDPNDLRIKILRLTPKGKALWNKIKPRYFARVEKVFGVLPIAQRQQFFENLKKLNDALWLEAKSPESNRWDFVFSD